MKIKKFEGATMRDALAKVKAELGDDAVIVSTRQIKRGLLGGTAVEISAASDEPEADLAPEPMVARVPRFATAPITQAPPSGAAPHAELEIEKMRSEMRSLRALVRSANDGKVTTELRAEVAALRGLVEQLAKAPPPAATPISAPLAAAPAAKKPTAPRPKLAPSHGRIVVLVGPTGAGKTTTIAKLAARAALIEQRTVAMVTLDQYRVGGVDQIKTFADLIGLPLQTASSNAALAEICELDDSEVIYVDTAGKSPRDARAIAELAAMLANIPEVEVHLAIPAATSPQMIDELIARYAPLSPARLLFTKLDEVHATPELLAAPSRANLPITWVTTGQAVPEDIEEPNAARLVQLATTGLPLASEVAA